MLYDSHCHIFKEYYENIDEIMDELKSNNISLIINNGCDKKSNEEVLFLVDKYPIMYGALGIHPESVEDYTMSDLEFINNNLNNRKILAIGEIGLDYHYGKDNRDLQIELFERQLDIAQDYNIPVIVHSRDALLDTIDCLKKYKLNGIIHSFSGSYETAQIFIKMGYYLGINGVITFKNSKLKDVVKRIGLNNIVIETDSPYLTPHPYRGEKNSPKNVKIIVDYLALLFETTPEEVEEITSKNLSRIFDIDAQL